MRSLSALLVGACSLLAGCSPGVRSHTPAPPVLAPAGVARPPWVPPPTEAQRAILASSRGMRVEAPAGEVHPDLGRFAYVAARPFDEARARSAREIVESTVRQSPRLYVVGVLEGDVANLVGQYGPPPPATPDRWVKASGAPDALRLEWASVPRAAAPAVAEANAALSRADLRTATAKLEVAIEKAPQVPALFIALAEARAASSDDAGAIAAAERALTVDPRQPDAHRLLAEARARSGDLDGARSAIARALALHPSWERAWAVAAAIATIRPRPPAPRIFLEVGEGGAIHVGTDAGARAYGTCRAAVRYEPELRAGVLGFPPATPYHLSVGEEVFCLEALLGATSHPEVQSPRDQAPPSAAPDASAGSDSDTLVSTDEVAAAPGSVETVPADLLDLAREGWLREYAAFDVVGRYRPEWLRLAPLELHEAVVRYLLERVLEPRRR